MTSEKEKSIFYFSLDARAFFESKTKVDKCPVTRKPLIPVESLPFLHFLNTICPITLEDLKEEDPELLLYDPENRVFRVKRYKKRLNPPNNNCKLVIEGKEAESFITLETFHKWKKEQGKPIYFIHEDGSYEVKP